VAWFIKYVFCLTKCGMVHKVRVLPYKMRDCAHRIFYNSSVIAL
jgi:hypothetical protein